MLNYYCKNCNNIIGKWDNEYECYDIINFCHRRKSKNFHKIYFLDCKNCDKFVGIYCCEVCKTCFGEDEIFEEKNLFNWFLKYEKLKSIKFDYYCKICNNKYYFRSQNWFFEELTFYKQ